MALWPIAIVSIIHLFNLLMIEPDETSHLTIGGAEWILTPAPTLAKRIR